MQKFLEKQLSNAFLYVPFIMACGGALYFGLNTEPNIPGIIFVTIAMAMGALFIRRPILIRAIMIFMFGFCYAMMMTRVIDTPRLTHDMRNAQVNATVTNIDYTTLRPRVFLRIKGTDIDTDNTGMATVRVTAMTPDNLPQIGDEINANISLFRPSPADAPETFDYAQWAYFNHITATGYMTDFSTIAPAKHTGINALRSYLHNKSNSMLVDGLVLGYKNVIPTNDRTIWTTAGIGHVWAISGFHIALVGGWIFAIFFGVFRLIAPITRRVPARQVATIATFLPLMAYVFISGASIATIRAFLMTILVGVAFVMGRSVISLRNVCMVFIIMFLVNPHCVMQAGFQLSFSAVFGLVWFWNDVNPTMPKNKILRVICIAALTSVVATIFTAPFIITHFNAMPLYSILGNLFLLPVFSIAIMPLVLIGAVTACIGGNWPLNTANTIYEYARTAAEHISSMPAANINMPFIPNSALLIIILGLVLMIFIRPVRSYIQYAICAACVIIGIIITATYPRPAFMITADNELAAFADGDTLKFNKARASNHIFTFGTWKQLYGISADTPNVRYKHNNGVYRYNTPEFNLVYIQKFVPLMKNINELCGDENLDYIVSYFDINAPMCKAKILRDGFVIYKSGKIKSTPTRRYWHRKSH